MAITRNIKQIMKAASVFSRRGVGKTADVVLSEMGGARRAKALS